MNLILKYFPGLSLTQRDQFDKLGGLYATWNAAINLISRPDLPFLYERHVLHSLAIARFVEFQPGADVMDLGTGGGFPGLPLAIRFPQTRFLLVDSTGKKIKAVRAIAEALGAANVETIHGRAESVNRLFDFVVSRATASLETLVRWTAGRYKKRPVHALPNGLVCLKGGDLADELKAFHGKAVVKAITDFFDLEHFKRKCVVYLPSGAGT